MYICNKDVSYKCENMLSRFSGDIHLLIFSITDRVTPEEIKCLFYDDLYYFYSEEDGILLDTFNSRIGGLRFTYNKDLTCDIILKLKKGDIRE